MAKIHMPSHIREQTELARIYAEDGAFQSADRVLADLAREVNAHAIHVHDELAATIKGGRSYG